jgi:hypothetical protein
MRALPIASLAALVLLHSSAHAVMRGKPTRDPDGLRQSVVRVENSQGELCSGTLIGSDLVLTAAHCVTDQASYRVVAVDRSFRPLTMKAIAAAIHPAFVSGTTPRTQPGVDLAILKLQRPFGPGFTPLDPRLGEQIGTGDMVMLAGFGVLAENQKNTARVLRQTALVSLGPMQVMNRVLVVADRERLAATAGAGACRGDSGGPILATGRGGHQLLGIVSWSSGAITSREASACGGLTAVTPIAEHARWIAESSAALGRLPTSTAAARPPRRGEAQWMKRKR